MNSVCRDTEWTTCTVMTLFETRTITAGNVSYRTVSLVERAKNVRLQRYCKCGKIIYINSVFSNLESTEFTRYQGRNTSVQLVERLSPARGTPQSSSRKTSVHLIKRFCPAHRTSQASSQNSSVKLAELLSLVRGTPRSSSSIISVQQIEHLMPAHRTPQ
jgi:hypothetical protein